MYRVWYWAIIDRESDGRFIASIPDLGDLAAYGDTDKDAVAQVTEPTRRHSTDLRGRRQDLAISLRDMATGHGIGLERLLRMEDGTATDEDKTFYRMWLSRIEGRSPRDKRIDMQRVTVGDRFR